jgi:hypothetical protein
MLKEMSSLSAQIFRFFTPKEPSFSLARSLFSSFRHPGRGTRPFHAALHTALSLMMIWGNESMIEV